MVSDVAIIGSVLVSALGAIFGLYQARKADRSATTTKTIELGVKDLIDQYQEANKEQREQIHECNERCKNLESKVAELSKENHEHEREIERLKTVIDNQEATIIKLTHSLGGLGEGN